MGEYLPAEGPHVSLPTGVRVGLVLTGLLVIAAAYLFWSPIQLYPASAFPVRCGSAADPPQDKLGKAACGDANAIRRWQAGAVLAGAATLTVGSLFAFGLRRGLELAAAPTRTPSDDEATGPG